MEDAGVLSPTGNNVNPAAPRNINPTAPVAVPPLQNQYNLRPQQGRSYSRWYRDNKQVDEANFFQTTGIPGVLKEVGKVHIPKTVVLDLIAHQIMLIMPQRLQQERLTSL